ncbi:hypothetical protein Bpfe_020380 [Biomphalaria pfeifferi]|uniref:Ig-like domain-containing protein n=1 Tax=Biomphalaria pfeifferi TaxID=112525 RepID=A0AAD8F3B2_BIOPF|nr:hypothetical protein Bpfe_020380 [Biomphalaria pfeifferi]
MRENYNLFLLWILSFLWISVMCLECGEVSEKKKYILTCPVNTAVLQSITWQVWSISQYREVITCFANGTVTATVDGYLTSDWPSCNLTILSLSRNMSQWQCTWNGGQSQPCKFQVYADPVQPTCDPPQFVSSNTAVSITCQTAQIYPQGICALYSLTDMGPLGNPRIFYQYPYWLGNSQESGMQCTFEYDLTQWNEPMTFVFRVGMKALVNTNETYSGNVSLTLQYPDSELDGDCPQDYIMPGSPVYCTCKLRRPGLPPGNAYWLSSSALKYPTFASVNNSRRLEISFDPTDLNPKFTCSSNSSVFQQKNPVFYEPKFAYGPDKVTLEALTSPILRFSDAPLSVKMLCKVRFSQVRPDVSISAYVSPNPSRLTVDPVHSDGQDYIASINLVPESPGTYNVTCVAQNTKFLTLSALSNLVIQVFGGSAHVKVNTTGSTERSICSSIPVSCYVTANGVYAGTLCSIYANSNLLQSRTSFERDVSFPLTHNFEPPLSGEYEVECVVININTSETLGRDSIKLKISGGSCDVNAMAIGLGAGLGGAVLLLAIVVVLFVVWRHRRIVTKKKDTQTVSFSVGDSKVKVIVQKNVPVEMKDGYKAMSEPPPDYFIQQNYDTQSYIGSSVGTASTGVSSVRNSGNDQEDEMYATLEEYISPVDLKKAYITK